jgi:MATE family multidrug resistance protein
MGIAGAAWGTLAGVSYRTVRLTCVLLGPVTHRAYASRDSWHPSLTKMKRLLRAGAPCGLHWLSEVVVWTIFVTVLIGTKFGTAHLVATNTAWQYLRLSFMPALGVGQALTALVGKSIGAGDPQRAMRETQWAATITLFYMGSLAVLYGVLGRGLIGLFSDDRSVIEIGGSIMICAAVFQLFDGLGITYNSALRGAGDTVVPSVFFVVSTWGIIVGCGWCVATAMPELGSLGPWIVASGLIAITGVFLWWRWNRRAWMKIDLFGRPPQQDGKVEREPEKPLVLPGVEN